MNQNNLTIIFFKKCQVTIEKNFDANFLQKTFGQLLLANKIEVFFLKGPKYLKIGDLLFF